MSGLSGRRILVGVTGGISAYKSAELIRRLIEHGAMVRVAMTAAATQFIAPLTLQAISGNPVYKDLVDVDSDAAMSHIEVARWADLVLVAPATANFIARLASGLADDLLSTICLATEAQIIVAPAMNRVMWENRATQENISTIRKREVSILGPDNGSQACGETGPGRMIEPDFLLRWIISQTQDKLLTNISVLVTAGPTWEAIDPVRGLTNKSSGKMGYAVASAAQETGANVTLISGPTVLSPPIGISVYSVTTALEMLSEVENQASKIDIFVAVAAVADYRPRSTQKQKIKKQSSSLNIELIRNPDILTSVANRPSPPFTVGFAAETDEPVEHARSKLASKNIDLIAVNEISGTNNPFGNDENALILIDKESETNLGCGSKQLLAKKLIKEISLRYHAKNSTSNS
uniref:Coenzyme A biosynthesis bifunctional protein CoaBC n=1 Tax=uncultured gamma proteobacterium HF0200_24F15 TaxID=723570 RepID=E7C3Y0_9GAMM|nr:phosphopantothenoylcysteine synthetase/decarboxylase [uncultured gamma proteobacterium HF0200_24F15]